MEMAAIFSREDELSNACLKVFWNETGSHDKALTDCMQEFCLIYTMTLWNVYYFWSTSVVKLQIGLIGF